MKKVFIKMIISFLTLILIICSINYVIDPYFHYRKPLSFLSYPIEYERYQNNGILKNFEYDAIIAGTSMAENFKTSELDKLFGTNSIKVTDSGGSYKEINDEINVAFNKNKKIKIVIRALDYGRLLDNKNMIRYNEEWYPTYLYDNNIFNDIKYLLNKSTLLSSISVIVYTLCGYETTTFDEYSNWSKDYEFGLNLSNYIKSQKKEKEIEYTKDDYEIEYGNLMSNVINIAIENKDTEFYYFFTPYSILAFYEMYQSGGLQKQLEAEKVAIELMLKQDNIKLFSFFDDESIICNLNNYRDTIHYGEHINSYILECMKNNKHLITKENCREYFINENKTIFEYNYDRIFEN